MKKQNGITLIALAITIVILLILVGVSITSITEDEGIVTKANEAKDKTASAQEQEKSDIGDIYDIIDENSKIPLASQITEKNYGDYVNYSKDLGLTLNLEGESSVPKTDWRIFYKEGERVYLIAADYVPNTSSLLKVADAGMTKNGTYSLYWSTVPSALATAARKDSLFGITSSSYVLTSNDNSKCISELLDTANWNNFVDSAVADYAIGGSTIEMYTNSWNAKKYISITPSSTSSLSGYQVNGANSVDVSTNKGYNDNLYYPHKTSSGIGTEDCSAYWLAAPSCINGIVNVLVSSSGSIGGSSYYGWNKIGVRPIVALLPGVTAQKDANGIWQLDV